MRLVWWESLANGHFLELGFGGHGGQLNLKHTYPWLLRLTNVIWSEITHIYGEMLRMSCIRSFALYCFSVVG